MKKTIIMRTVTSAGILLATFTNIASAASVVHRDILTTANGSDIDLLFDPLENVADLVEIDAGSVSTFEGGTFVVNAINDDDSLTELYRRPLANNETISLSTLTMDAFTDQDPAIDIKGLNLVAIPGPVGIPGTVSIPANTTISFSVVPEPTALFSSMVGFFLIGLRRRR